MTDPVSSSSIISSSLAGMERAQTQFEKAAAKIAQIPAVAKPGQTAQSGDSVDLSAQMVAMMSARDNFMSNVEAAKTGDQMQRSLLNMLG